MCHGQLLMSWANGHRGFPTSNIVWERHCEGLGRAPQVLILRFPPCAPIAVRHSVVKDLRGSHNEGSDSDEAPAGLFGRLVEQLVAEVVRGG